MSNSGLSLAAQIGGKGTSTDKTSVLSTRRRVPTKWVAGRTLQSFTEAVIANFYVPSDFLVDCQIRCLIKMNPLLNLSFFSTSFYSFQEEDVVIRNRWISEDKYVNQDERFNPRL